MRSNGKIKVLLIFALLFAVSSLTFAYAALQAQLSISGSATVDPLQMDFNFTSATSSEDGTGNGGSVISAGTVNDTSLENIEVKLQYPSSSAMVKATITNSGKISGKIVDVNISVSAPVSEVLTNERILRSNLIIYVYASDKTTLYGKYENGEFVQNSGNFTNSSIIAENETEDVYIKMEYPFEATEIPSEETTLSGINITITYQQAQAGE